MVVTVTDIVGVFLVTVRYWGCVFKLLWEGMRWNGVEPRGPLFKGVKILRNLWRPNSQENDSEA